MIVGIALIVGIYAVLRFSQRDDIAEEAMLTLAYIQQNPAIDPADEKMTDPWGNPVALVNTGTNTSITFQEVPPGACKHIARNFEKGATFISLSVNSTIFRESAEEINADTVAKACTEKDKALMIWTFAILDE